jgi:hypothetical protein
MSLTKVSYSMITGAVYNVLDYGAVGNGIAEDTAAINAAITAAAGGTVYLPKGTYLVGNLNAFIFAGTQIVGESKYTTILKAKSGLSNSILRNSNADLGTSAYCAVRSLTIDLTAQNINGVDFNGVNNSVAQDLYIIGGSSIGTANGNGILFGAPLDVGSYSNMAQNCTMLYLAKGVKWGVGGNQNIVLGGETLSCIVGLDTNPGGAGVDTPKVYGTRIETCTTGLNEGASYGFYSGLRFENNGRDIAFQTASDHPQFIGGFTATSPIVLDGLGNSNSPIIQSSDLGWYEIEASTSRPIQLQGKRIFTAPGSALPAAPTGSYAAYFQDELWIKNNLWIKTLNAAGTGQVFAVSVDTSNRTNIRSFNSATSTDGDVIVGNGAYVRPLADNITALGSASERWSVVYAATGTINTSDANLKQDLEEFNEAERLVAIRIKGLIKKFRFKDAVAKKGNAARIHVGVIAQEVQAAFEDNGLDATNYGIFCLDTWYTLNDEIVPAETDGATKVTQLGVRYDELLCFVIGAM